MHQEVAVVDQDPFGVGVAFEARGVFTQFPKLLLNLVRDSLNLARISAGTYQKIVGKGGSLAHVEYHNVARLLGFGGMHGGKPKRFRFVQDFRPSQVTVLLLPSYYNREGLMLFFLLAAVTAFGAD